MLGLTKPAVTGQQGRPLAPQDAAATCKYVGAQTIHVCQLMVIVYKKSKALFFFLKRVCVSYIQVSSACASSRYESDRFAGRASERPVACPSG